MAPGGNLVYAIHGFMARKANAENPDNQKCGPDADRYGPMCNRCIFTRHPLYRYRPRVLRGYTWNSFPKGEISPSTTRPRHRPRASRRRQFEAGTESVERRYFDFFHATDRSRSCSIDHCAHPRATRRLRGNHVEIQKDEAVHYLAN